MVQLMKVVEKSHTTSTQMSSNELSMKWVSLTEKDDIEA